MVEHADESRVPANPHAPPRILGWYGAVRLVDLYVPVAVDNTPAFQRQVSRAEPVPAGEVQEEQPFFRPALVLVGDKEERGGQLLEDGNR